MQPIDKFLDRLDRPRKSGKGWIACCPAHDDRSPSLSVSEGDNGYVLLWCHAGCSKPEICHALGLSEQDMFPPKPEPAHIPGTLKQELRPYFNKKQLDEIDMQAWFAAIAHADLKNKKPIPQNDINTLHRTLKSLKEARWSLFCADHLDMFMRVDFVLSLFETRREAA